MSILTYQERKMKFQFHDAKEIVPSCYQINYANNIPSLELSADDMGIISQPSITLEHLYPENKFANCRIDPHHIYNQKFVKLIQAEGVNILFCLNRKLEESIRNIILLSESSRKINQIHIYHTDFESGYIVGEIGLYIMDRFFKEKKLNIEIYIHTNIESLFNKKFKNHFHIVEYRNASSKSKSYDVYRKNIMTRDIVSYCLNSEGYFISDFYDVVPINSKEYTISIHKLDNQWIYRNIMVASYLNNPVIVPRRFQIHELTHFNFLNHNNITDICYFYEKVSNTIRKYLLFIWCSMVALLLLSSVLDDTTFVMELFFLLLLLSLIVTKLRSVTWLVDLDILSDIVHTASVTTYVKV